MTRKVLTVNGVVCIKGRWRSGLISCEGLVWEVRKTVWGGMWGILGTFYCNGVRVTGKIKSDETVSKNEFKRHIEKMNWDSTVKRKRLNGQFLRGIPGTTHVRLRNLELDTESRLEDPNRSTYLCSPGTGSQDQLHNDKAGNPPLCRLHGEN